MFCTNCGTRNDDDSAFCCNCGKPFGVPTGNPNPQPQPQPQPQPYSQPAPAYGQNAGRPAQNYINNYNAKEDAELARYNINPNSPELKEIFIDPDEKFIAKMGNGFLVNVLSGQKLRKTAGILSDKRVYFKGKMFSLDKGKFTSNTCFQTINADEITGTGFVYQTVSLVSLIVELAILLFITIFLLATTRHMEATFIFLFLLAAGLSFLAYFLFKKVFFFVEYPGGRVMFDATRVGIKEVQAFQKKLCRVSDIAKGKSVKEL